MSYKIFRVFFVLTLMMGLEVFLTPQPVRAAGPWYVSSIGDDNNDCLSPDTTCATINGAIGKAADGDTINVATGTYTGSGSYVVTIAKSLTLSGGWDATFTTNNGISTIDGQNARGGVSTAYYEYVFATMDRFVIQNGRTTQGGGIFSYYDTVILNNSAVINNVSTENGGGLLILGVLTLNNSTISGNKATGNGGGISFFNQSGDPVTLNNSTIVNNSASQGGGLSINFYGSPQPTAILQNSIVANNTATTGPDCFGTINLSDHNIISNTSDCTVSAGTGDQFNVNPLISSYPLGISSYHALLVDSPAIDAGDPTTCLSIDQRGVSRPQEAACDIGAYEYTIPGTATSLGVSAGSNQHVQSGLPLSIPFITYVVDDQGSPVSDITVTFDAPASGPSGTFASSGTNSSTAISDSSGLAIASLFTANDQTGNYNVTATASGLSNSATFELINAVWADADWFVAPTGSDTNSCNSPDSPCLTINSAIYKAADGEKIDVATGFYASSSSSVVEINKNTTISGGWNTNFSAQSGSSIIDGQNYAAGFSISSPVTVDLDHFFIQNSGTGIYLSYNPVVTLNNVTISGNGLGAYGGGIYMTSGTLTINNSTITQNTAGASGGGIYLAVNGVYPVAIAIQNSTIANNNAGSGGGIGNEGGTVILRNSILANNTATTGPDCSGSINTSDHNIISTTSSCTVTAGTGDQLDVDPQLSTFLPTQGYYPLLADSPAIDNGDNATCLTTDQRGVERDSTCDIGAYEYTTPGPAANLSVVSGSGQLASTSSAFPKPLQAAALDSQGTPVSGVIIDFTAPASGPSGTFADAGTNTTSVTTDAGGVATTSIFTANDQAGVYTVTASATGLGSVNFDLEQIPRPANDDFANAEAITSLPFSATPDITNATTELGEPPQSCSAYGKSVWYSFTPAETVTVRADTLGSSISGILSIYSSTGIGLSDLQFLQCSGSGNSPSFLAEAGQTYYIQASPVFDENGIVQVNLQQVFPPANDIFANAEAITSLPFSATPDITNATIELGEPQNCSSTNQTVWYSFTPTETMSIRVDSQGSSVNGNVNIYSTTGTGLSGLQFLQCAISGVSVTFLAEAGQTYYIQVSPIYSGIGTVQVNLQQVFPPANDIFANAEIITSLPFSATADITDTTIEPGEPQNCYGIYTTVWYSFTPTETMSVRVDTLGSSIYNSTANIYSTSGTGLSGLQFLQCSGPISSATFLAEAGQTYYIQAGSFSYGEVGPVQINLQQVFPPANDLFSNSDIITSLPFSATADITDTTTEPGEPQNCNSMNQTVWYSFTPTETMKVSADTRGSAINGNVNIYHATGPGISDLQFMQCSGPSGTSIFTAEAGQTYYLQAGPAYGEVGAVQLNLTEVSSITGRITDAITGAPLPYASVMLQRICGDGCFEYVNSLQADSEGRFLFDSYYYGVPLVAGTYQIEASANLYQTKQFGPFEFSGANLDLGDVPLNPPAVIRGRTVDSNSGNPLVGASVTLRRCDTSGCFEDVNSQSTDDLGQFQFNSFYYGPPLPGGTYELEISAALHETKRIEVVISDGENRDLGDVQITPLPLIGSIRGLLVDKATGKPVSQTFTPSVQLYRCNDAGCFEFVNSQVPDNNGKFRFETDSSGNRLPVGKYQILAFADQYQQAQSNSFDVGKGANRNVGNLRITSFPVRFSELQSCADIPASGGECAFSIKITNGTDKSLKGSAWSLVNSSLPDSFAGYTNFQPKSPQELELDRGKSKVFRFRFNVPANNGSYGSYICTRVFVGDGNNSFFNTVGLRDLFCVLRNAGGFTIASPQEAMAALAQENAITATGTEVEPNNSCQAAQDVGAVSQIFILDGNLDSSQTPDVDFFRFTGTPGMQATVDLEGQSTGKGTLGDPFLGFFDSNCSPLAFNDDSGTPNSRLEITFPADGVFVLGATTCCDSGFYGGGNGSYQLTITPVQYIGSISGRVKDAATGKPLHGDAAPFAFVRLLQCGQFGCVDVNNQTAGSDGRFSFATDSNGAPLRAANYMVVISADQYQTTQTDIFAVGENENHALGNVALTSFPVRFSDIKPCVISSDGGTCEFSVKITNGLSTKLSGKAWSLINGSGIGSFTNFTNFQTDTPLDVKLDPGKSSVLRFKFRVRGSVDDGANICTTVFVGQGTNAFFNTVGQSYLFCFVKGSSGFTLMSVPQTQDTLQQLQIQEVAPSNLPVEKNK